MGVRRTRGREAAKTAGKKVAEPRMVRGDGLLIDRDEKLEEPTHI